MKILNTHSRKIDRPIEELSHVIDHLGSEKDSFWPYGKWPKMWLEKGMELESRGGHGPIRYFIDKYIPGKEVWFSFTAPKGFEGHHKLQLNAVSEKTTDIIHTIDMKASLTGIVKWLLAIRWLHDALLEDALDNIENHFHGTSKMTSWNLWVKTLRIILK